jgi:hypothetical protein
MNSLARWWARIVGTPARAFARRLAGRFPRRSYDGIDLVISAAQLERDAERFFARTQEALACAAARAPKSYARLRKDIRSIVLLVHAPRSLYHPLQLAALVPVETALESDSLAYATWLLYVSGLSHSREHALRRTEELLLSLDQDQRREVEAWLSASGEVRE